MSGRTKKQEKAMRRAARASARAAQVHVVGFDETVPDGRETTTEQMNAWAVRIRDQFIRIGGQDAYSKRAEEILAVVRDRSLREGTHPLDAAMKYEQETRRRIDIDHDYKIVLGALILAVSFLEFKP